MFALPRLCLLLAGLLAGLLVWAPATLAADADSRPQGLLLQIQGTLGPASLDYLEDGFARAEKQGFEAIILQMDTPGGLVSTTRELVSLILNSHVPVITWVGPAGAQAASAGTYILYASHLAAMAPTTQVGAATPVNLMGGGTPAPESQPADTSSRSSLEQKQLQAAVSSLRSLAERYGRNADWAEKAVRQADSLTAQEALDLDVIELMAADLDELLQALQGRELLLKGDQRVQHSPAPLQLVEQNPDWRHQLLAFLTQPTLAYFLLLIGFYGLLFELSSPGSLFPGILGACSLLLALYAFQLLPVNYAGLALIVFGVLLIIAEALVPSFGILGIGGILAFTSGSVLLMDSEHLALSLPLIGGLALIASALLLWAVTRFWTLRSKRPTIGQEALEGEVCEALEDFSHKGRVRFHGENWQARRTHPEGVIRQGSYLQVTGHQGLTLMVEPLHASRTETVR
ncbi:NfeD family protein [Marinospirillum perlucidum]|uniref:NfeD family protein n=1 Tax=Marinospirillum perlucidum TaxID=1982602 RepID=UPI000DF27A83|nr:nodulation protein NfeD [Marinospirillum perlucidum]